MVTVFLQLGKIHEEPKIQFFFNNINFRSICVSLFPIRLLSKYIMDHGSLKILKKAGRIIFSKFHNFEEIAGIISFRKISSSLFQYSERTIAT